jgi:hypothetical protein
MNMKMDKILVAGTHLRGWKAHESVEQALKRKVIRSRGLAHGAFDWRSVRWNDEK